MMLLLLRPPLGFAAVQAADKDCNVLGEWATKYSTAAQQMGWTDLSTPLWCCQDAAGVQCDSAHRVVSLNVSGKDIEGARARYVRAVFLSARSTQPVANPAVFFLQESSRPRLLHWTA